MSSDWPLAHNTIDRHRSATAAFPIWPCGSQAVWDVSAGMPPMVQHEAPELALSDGSFHFDSASSIIS